MRTSRRRFKTSNRINWSHPVGRRIRMGLAALALVAVGGAVTAIAISATSDPPAPQYNPLTRVVNPISAPGRAHGLSRLVIHPSSQIPLPPPTAPIARALARAAPAPVSRSDLRALEAPHVEAHDAAGAHVLELIDTELPAPF